MKFPWTIVAVLAVTSLTATPTSDPFFKTSNEYNARWSAAIEDKVKERINRLAIPFEAQYDQEVRNRVKDYVTDGYRDTERMLGRTSTFFPIFEHYLSIHGLPRELRYLPVVETGLQTKAHSHAGAAGLWQFIRPTARLYDLEVTNQVDERYDVHRSSEAAVLMLSRLHSHYKDWSLVLAAYNCGPARVNAAIKQAGSRDYYSVANFLPQETRHYIPRFIAAAYISNYYSHHGLTPDFRGVFNQPISSIKLYDRYTFGEIAHASGVSVSDLRTLNPAYFGNIIPKSADGHFLLLPASGMQGVKAMISSRSGRSSGGFQLLYPNAYKMNYKVRPGETIEDIANRFTITTTQIQNWNQLKEATVFVHQELALFVTNDGSKSIKP
ncbi:MAG: transglycosylase SLT domain-containing protein [Phaeodactylibacter sp.]|nr:transglycosylase SLT domain-containing protein [Phaeodactylibacter sp.]